MKRVELTQKQQECVEFPSDRDLIVTGVAGSGKSLVVVSRAVKFSRMAREAGEPIRIALFTFVNTLVSYTQEVVAQGGRNASQDVKVTTLDKEIIDLYKAITRRRIDYSNLYDAKLHAAYLADVISAIPLPEEISRKKILSEDRREWLMEELCWIKQHMFTEAEQYLNCVRKGRGRVQLRREDRPFVFELYRRYYAVLKENSIKTIDMICEEIYQSRAKIPAAYRYDMVLIDEAQDLPLNKLLIARELAESSVTVAADFAQKIYRTGFTWKEIGLDIKGRGSQKLRGTHRNTRQIAMLALGLQQRNTEEYEDGDITVPELPEREGPLPCLIYCSSLRKEGQMMCNLARQILIDSPNATIGILARDFANFQWTANCLNDAGLPFEEVSKRHKETRILTPGIKLVTYHSAKGLEFDQVILPRIDEGLFPYTLKEKDLSEEGIENLMNNARNLLYVGMTRAREMLYMLATDGLDGSPSPLLDELDASKLHIIR